MELFNPRKQKWLCIAFLTLIYCFSRSPASAQNCPLNVDFELGNFTNWEAYRGSTYASGVLNYINVVPSVITSNVHTVIPKGTLRDYYTGLAQSAPGGGAYSVKLGNDGTGSQAERISYKFTVPQNQADFVITYQYAVVLQDGGHAASNQARFTAKVFDITANNYITCGSFDYIATANLPGFKANGDIVYKDWTPVAINLYGYQGHQLQLEFTTADCTQGGHFGYAYVDVNSSCASLITGTNFCPSEPATLLTGPAGFDQYNWYNADKSKLLGTGVKLTISPPPADNTTIQLDLIPFTGFGCPYTTSAVLHALPDIKFVITDPPPVCSPSAVNITDAAVTKGSDTNLNYTYWKDIAATVALASPNAITASGTYYIKATAPSGCTDIQPVKVDINFPPVIKITNPAKVCLATPVDITLPAIVAGSPQGLTYTYWKDAAATIALLTPTNITTAGTYYIKGTFASGCNSTMPVVVSYFPLPVLNITDPAAICFPNTADLTVAAITGGSDPNLALTYYTDAAATKTLSTPAAVASAGTYYIKAVNANGCISIAPVKVTLNPLPDLITTNPPEVCNTSTVDLTLPLVTAGSSNVYKLSYWKDPKATNPLNNPRAVADSGVYYIKAISQLGCEMVKPVTVIIHQPPVVKITNPATVCLATPVDITPASLVAGSSPKLTYAYWADAAATVTLKNATAITTAGTYYISATNEYGCVTIKPISVTYFPLPVIIINSPAAVCYPSTIDLTANSLTQGSDSNLSFTYFTDQAGTRALNSPQQVATSGTYYIRATNANSCQQIAAVTVTINPLPQLIITNPADACWPETVNLTAASVTKNSTNVSQLSYWMDANATIALQSPAAVADSGLYYIKATSPLGCEMIKPVTVGIHQLPVVKTSDPAKVYTPQTIDLTKAEVTAGSSPNLKFTYYNDAAGSDMVSSPKNITKTGTYYVKGVNTYGCYTIKPVAVTVAEIPQILVPKAFTPTQATNNRLYPFLLGVKTLISFKVINRWGNIVFQTDNADPAKGWDGVYRGQIQFLDTVTWYAEGYDYVGKVVRKSGNTVLLK